MKPQLHVNLKIYEVTTTTCKLQKNIKVYISYQIYICQYYIFGGRLTLTNQIPAWPPLNQWSRNVARSGCTFWKPTIPVFKQSSIKNLHFTDFIPDTKCSSLKTYVHFLESRRHSNLCMKPKSILHSLSFPHSVFHRCAIHEHEKATLNHLLHNLWRFHNKL